jgi:GTP cyclohydrolase FolE2
MVTGSRANGWPSAASTPSRSRRDRGGAGRHPQPARHRHPSHRLPEGGPAWIDAPELLRIVEQSMSSEIYELMKRPDELAVVAKAHAQPRFVEDCVREMVRRVILDYPTCPATPS